MKPVLYLFQHFKQLFKKTHYIFFTTRAWKIRYLTPVEPSEFGQFDVAYFSPSSWKTRISLLFSSVEKKVNIFDDSLGIFRDINTLEIPYNEIPCSKASLLRARHASP